MSFALPVLADDNGLSRYLQQIKQFPVLKPDEEYMLAQRWRQHQDVTAAHKLVTSHLRLVARMAFDYRHYGLPVADLIAEGNVGLMRAIKMFEPERGFRLSTYAMWWIKASLNEFVLSSWSLVRMGTRAAHKKLFFNLAKIKRKLKILENGELTPEQAREIATALDVGSDDVIEMNRRLHSRDTSLNRPLQAESDEEWQDFLADERDNQEESLTKKQQIVLGNTLLAQAMDALSERERHILTERRLRDTPQTLEEIGRKLGISRERVRQIEEAAFKKLQLLVKASAEQAAFQV